MTTIFANLFLVGLNIRVFLVVRREDLQPQEVQPGQVEWVAVFSAGMSMSLVAMECRNIYQVLGGFSDFIQPVHGMTWQSSFCLFS